MRNKMKKWRRGHGMEYIDEKGVTHQLTNRQVKMMMREYNTKASPSELFGKLLDSSGHNMPVEMISHKTHKQINEKEQNETI